MTSCSNLNLYDSINVCVWLGTFVAIDLSSVLQLSSNSYSVIFSPKKINDSRRFTKYSRDSFRFNVTYDIKFNNDIVSKKYPVNVQVAQKVPTTDLREVVGTMRLKTETLQNTSWFPDKSCGVIQALCFCLYTFVDWKQKQKNR